MSTDYNIKAKTLQQFPSGITHFPTAPQDGICLGKFANVFRSGRKWCAAESFATICLKLLVKLLPFRAIKEESSPGMNLNTRFTYSIVLKLLKTE
jgi:hypothetical protein